MSALAWWSWAVYGFCAGFVTVLFLFAWWPAPRHRRNVRPR